MPARLQRGRGRALLHRTGELCLPLGVYGVSTLGYVCQLPQDDALLDISLRQILHLEVVQLFVSSDEFQQPYQSVLWQLGLILYLVPYLHFGVLVLRSLSAIIVCQGHQMSLWNIPAHRPLSIRRSCTVSKALRCGP